MQLFHFICISRSSSDPEPLVALLRVARCHGPCASACLAVPQLQTLSFLSPPLCVWWVGWRWDDHHIPPVLPGLPPVEPGQVFHPDPSCVVITNNQFGISGETVFLRWESPFLLSPFTPSGGGGSNSQSGVSHHIPPPPGGTGLSSHF